VEKMKVEDFQWDIPQMPQSQWNLNIPIGQGTHFHVFPNLMLVHLSHNIKNEKHLNKL
jgi:hypothetical protein